MHWLDITTQVSQIAGVVSVVFAAIAIRSNTRLSQKQWNIENFNTYSERHQAVIDQFPDDAFYKRFEPDKLPKRSPALTKSVRRYLFVICSVHYLSHQNYLDESIWSVWRRDLHRTLKTQLITREWPELKQEFSEFTEFTQFVETVMAGESAQ